MISLCCRVYAGRSVSETTTKKADDRGSRRKLNECLQ